MLVNGKYVNQHLQAGDPMAEFFDERDAYHRTPILVGGLRGF
jgi:hypothetical protein